MSISQTQPFGYGTDDPFALGAAQVSVSQLSPGGGWDPASPSAAWPGANGLRSENGLQPAASAGAERGAAFALEGASVSQSGPVLAAGGLELSWGAGPPLRVAHVGQSLVRAGIEMWLKSLVRFADPRRLQFVRSVVTSQEYDGTLVRELGIPVEVGGAAAVRRAAEDCDALLCWGPAELGGWLNGTRPKLCVFVAHGESPWTRRILDGCAPVIDHVVAVSRLVQDRACEGFPTTVIANGIDAAHVAQSRPRDAARRDLGFAPDDFVVGFVGRFAEEKRVHALIEAVAGLPSRFKALLVGWGNLRYRLMDLANARMPGRYTFVSAHSHLGDYYRAMDAFCLPSAHEGFALVVLEAMFCERPVIVTPVGCVPEVIEDRVNGIVIDGSADSIRRAVRLLDQHPDWARSLAREGRRHAEQHGHARDMTRRYEDLFARLWAEKGGLSAGNGAPQNGAPVAGRSPERFTEDHTVHEELKEVQLTKP